MEIGASTDMYGSHMKANRLPASQIEAETDVFVYDGLTVGSVGWYAAGCMAYDGQQLADAMRAPEFYPGMSPDDDYGDEKPVQRVEYTRAIHAR